MTDTGIPEFLRTIASQGRFTGTPELERARELCAARLRGLGFTVHERPFRYSTLPARFGMPAVGLTSAGLLVAVAALAARDAPGGAALVAGGGLLLVVLLAGWLSSAAASGLSWAQASGTNLEAVRSAEPTVWLVAHLDSKSQRYPLGLRVAGAVLSLGAWIIALITVVGRLGQYGWWHAWFLWLPAVAGGGLLTFASSGNDSPGAVDNASGVAAVLAAAEWLPPDTPVGILITDAEEMGMAGAHAWARGRAPGVALNCDTVDDQGQLLLLTAGRRPGRITAALAAAAEAAAIDYLVRPVPPGALTDGLALSRAGWECATLGRATLGTLFRIHTPRDSVEHLEGRGVADSAAVLAALIEELA